MKIIDKEFADEIRGLWRKSGYTLKKLQKKYFLGKDTLYNIIKNTKQSNDINRNGFRVVKDFGQKSGDRQNNRPYKKHYHNHKKSYDHKYRKEHKEQKVAEVIK